MVARVTSKSQRFRVVCRFGSWTVELGYPIASQAILNLVAQPAAFRSCCSTLTLPTTWDSCRRHVAPYTQAAQPLRP